MSNHNNEKVIQAAIELAQLEVRLRTLDLHDAAQCMWGILQRLPDQAAKVIERAVRNDIEQAERDKNWQEGTR